jgi:hypothetical protein
MFHLHKKLVHVYRDFVMNGSAGNRTYVPLHIFLHILITLQYFTTNILSTISVTKNC